MEVPLKKIRCGKCLKTGPGCFLSLPEGAPRLEFHWRDNNSKQGENISFKCTDVSAVDLRVETKFGSIDAMNGTLTVECLSPIVENRIDAPPLLIKDQISGSENFIIEATFHVNETGTVRDIIRKLRGICLSNQKDKNGSSCTSTNVPKTKVGLFREGLPDWVAFIPHGLYSKRTRQCIELAIFVYMIFSVTWALWQLYRHVDFVRELVTPLIEMLQYQYQLLDNMIQLFNTIFEEYTTQWLCFIKPLYTISMTLASPLWMALQQMTPFLNIFLQGVRSIWQLLWPVAKPLFSLASQFIQFICSIFSSLKMIMSRFWSPFYNISVPAVVSAQFRSVKQVLEVVYHSLGQARHLDPLKAQFVLVRTTVINSSKALGLGIVHLARKVYKIIWLRRSARHEREE